jgi:hypothetical protein
MFDKDMSNCLHAKIRQWSTGYRRPGNDAVGTIRQTNKPDELCKAE